MDQVLWALLWRKEVFFRDWQHIRIAYNIVCECRALHLPLRKLIDKEIVNIIIGNMMFHPEVLEGITLSRLLESFVPTLYYSEDAADVGNVS